MSEVLSEFPKRFVRGKSSRYEQYLDGRIWRIAQSDAPTTSAAGLRSGLMALASVRGLRLKTSAGRGGGFPLIVQAVKL